MKKYREGYEILEKYQKERKKGKRKKSIGHPRKKTRQGHNRNLIQFQKEKKKKKKEREKTQYAMVLLGYHFPQG